MADFQNEGYNYYYGVTDNKDLMQWMRDIDESMSKVMNRVNEHSTQLSKHETKIGEIIDVVNNNADIQNHHTNALAGGVWLFWGVAGLLILGGLAIYDLYCQVDRIDTTVSNLSLDVNEIEGQVDKLVEKYVDKE